MKIRYLFLAFALFSPLVLQGQESDFCSRTSIGADWKIKKGLHLEGGYELRTEDNFTKLDRHQLTLGINWSPVKHLSVGGGYNFIGGYGSENDFKPRHRVYVQAAGSFKTGAWKFSLREKLQMTHNAYEFNQYQQTPNFLELKSRLKVAYKGLIRIEPYFLAEMKNCFNAPSQTYSFNETTGKYSDYQFLGYSDAYISRLRAALGLQWNINLHHAIDFKFMEDWCHRKDIDTNAEGTKLKSIGWSKSLDSSLCIGYIFSF